MSKTTAGRVIARNPCIPEQLNIALKEGCVEKVSQLLSQGANVNQMYGGQYPLHVASEGTSFEMVKMLVEAGAHVDRRDECQYTALMYACRNGHGSIGSYLVKNGAAVNVNAGYVYGTTPLMLAIRATSLSVPLISALLKANACINGCDWSGVTPLRTILERGGRLRDEAMWDVLELLLSYSCDINAKETFYGATLLHKAVQSNDRKLALLLIQAGCKVDIADRWGRVPMSHAIEDKLYPLVELLLAAGERIPRGDWMDVRKLLKNEDFSMLERLLAVGAECPKLSIMCRRSFYDHYGTQARNRIKNQPLSPLIKRYLSFGFL